MQLVTGTSFIAIHRTSCAQDHDTSNQGDETDATTPCLAHSHALTDHELYLTHISVEYVIVTETPLLLHTPLTNMLVQSSPSPAC